MSVKRRGDAWEVTVNWKGRRYRESSRLWTRDQALEVRRKLLNDLHAVSVGQKPARTFNEAVKKFIEDVLPGIKDQEREKSHLRALAPFMEGRLLTDAQDVVESAKRAWRLPTKRKPKGLRPGTINRRVAIVRWILNLAWAKWKWLDQPIADTIDLVPNRHQRHVYATHQQAHALADECRRGGGYVLLAAYTGVRRGQLLQLTAGDVVRVSGSDCLNLGTDGKTGQPQLVPLHPKVRALARRLPLCTDQVLRDDWEAARRALGLQHLRFNDLRHSAASWLLQSGASLKHVSDLLGHSDIRMSERYAHLLVADLTRAIAKMGSRRA